jgi:hypothetical protein
MICKADFQSIRSGTRPLIAHPSKPQHMIAQKQQLQTDGLQESILVLFFPNLLSFSEAGDRGTRRPFSATQPPSKSISDHVKKSEG